MRVLLLGGGGREHALGWKLSQSPHLTELLTVPGNPGLAGIGPVIPGVDIEDPAAVAALAVAESVDLVVVGPEGPLAAGVVDALVAKGIPTFGPGRAAAQLESSKAFAKEIMRCAGVPTGDASSFTDVAAATAFLADHDGPYVVKADGLAAGKGVLVTSDVVAAQAWARLCLEGHFGQAGRTIVIEEHLRGDEVSVFALCDGTTAIPLAPARDYKRLRDGDLGPNTGGMGCYSPPDDLPDDLIDVTMDTVIRPVLHTLAAEGIPYRGFLYAGLMLTADGMQVLEFNCRMGDPETQALMPRLEDDLLELVTDAAQGSLSERRLEWRDDAAVDVVLAAPGYPDAPERGSPISGVGAAEAMSDVIVFHAGTGQSDEGLVTAGGRVMNVVGLGATVSAARSAAYRGVDAIDFPGMQYRLDIAASTGTDN
jgi:phosphoribosylamine--glycine ligase